MEKKYIMAQINIPIEVLTNGQTHPHVRCAQIEFLPCDKLPPEHENPNQFIMEKMSAWLGGEGFMGTGGAVKPRSSVDVDELRSSKSMDDDIKKTETFTESKHITEPEEGRFTEGHRPGVKRNNDGEQSSESLLLLSLFISKEDIARTVKTRGQTITFKNYPKAIRSRSLTEKNR